MPLVNAQCTNCGAKLEIDNCKEAAMCPHCGSAFIVQKAINNYNSNNYNNVTIANATIIQNAPKPSNKKSNEEIKNELIQTLDFYMNHNDYNNAYKLASKLLKDEPYNVRYYNIQFKCILERYNIDDSYKGDSKDALNRIKEITKYENDFSKYNSDSLIEEASEIKEKLLRHLISYTDSIYASRKLSQLKHLLSVIEESYKYTDDITIKDKLDALKENINPLIRKKKAALTALIVAACVVALTIIILIITWMVKLVIRSFQ